MHGRASRLHPSNLASPSPSSFVRSIALYLIFLFTYGSLLWASQSFFHVPHHMMRLAMYWLLLLLVPTVSFAIDYGVMAFKTIFFPTPVDIAIELDRYCSYM